MENQDENPQAERFIPKGAIAFFILLALLSAAIWFGIYFIMQSRS